jgi:hypothetical protein
MVVGHERVWVMLVFLGKWKGKREIEGETLQRRGRTFVFYLYDDNLSLIIRFIIYSVAVSIKVKSITFFHYLAYAQ